MNWAKREIGNPDEWNLAASGVGPVPLEAAEIAELLDGLELEGSNEFGYPPLMERIAGHSGVAVEQVIAAQGTSEANFVAMSVVLRAGDSVVLENPAYEPLEQSARLLRAKVERVAIDGPQGLDGFIERSSELLRSGRARLVVLSDLQNPTGAEWGEQRLLALHEAARAGGGYVLVDEVYLDFLRAAGLPQRDPAVRLGERFLCTNSLTKVYGLGALRIGWCLLPGELVDAAWDTRHALGAVGPFVPEFIAARLWNHPVLWERLRRKAFGQIEDNRRTVAEFLEAAPEILLPIPRAGSVGLAGLRSLEDDQVLSHLRELREATGVLLTPGHFFARPGKIRLAWGAPRERVSGALARWSSFLEKRRIP